jgi:hypothetical protein
MSRRCIASVSDRAGFAASAWGSCGKGFLLVTDVDPTLLSSGIVMIL